MTLIDIAANFASSSLNAGITNVATSMTVPSGEGARFPVAPFMLTLWDQASASPDLTTSREIVRVTAVAGDTFTITRAQEGTTARAFNAGDKALAGATVGQWNALPRAASNIGAQTNPTAMTTLASIVIPANYLAIGDHLRFHGHIQLSATATTSGPRCKVLFGANDWMGQQASWGTSDLEMASEGDLWVTGSATQVANSKYWRPFNGALAVANKTAPNQSITASITVALQGYFPTSSAGVTMTGHLTLVINKA